MDVHGESRMNVFLSFVSFKPYTLTSFLNFKKLGLKRSKSNWLKKYFNLKDKSLKSR